MLPVGDSNAALSLLLVLWTIPLDFNCCSVVNYLPSVCQSTSCLTFLSITSTKRRTIIFMLSVGEIASTQSDSCSARTF